MSRSPLTLRIYTQTCICCGSTKTLKKAPAAAANSDRHGAQVAQAAESLNSVAELLGAQGLSGAERVRERWASDTDFEPDSADEEL